MTENTETLDKPHKFQLYKYINGAPPKYKSIKAFTNKIKQYFTIEDKITLNGLAIYLGFESRQSMYDILKRKNDFSYILEKAITIIEAYHEWRLSNSQCAGSIFWLKNRGWTDDSRQIVDIGDNLASLLRDLRPTKGILPGQDRPTIPAEFIEQGLNEDDQAGLNTDSKDDVNRE